MKRGSHFLPPRQTIVYGYTRRMLDETATNANSFALVVAERYLESVAPDVRQVKLKLGEGDALARAMKDNGQVLRRYMDGTVKVLPADLEDAWVTALPEPYRSDCERDLARRRGLLCVQVVDSTADAVVSVGKLTSDFSELLNAIAPALADGRLDAADVVHARRIINESDDMISGVFAIRRALQELVSQSENASA
jgi:hypothetical protein